MTEIGLFPLNLVLLPSERVPLHIFEDRYKEMIGDCLETVGEFGLVLVEKTELRTVGTTASVIEVLNRYEDGRLDIVVEGQKRFRITRVTEGRSWLTAETQPFVDEEDGVDAELVTSGLQALEDLAKATGTDPEALDVAGDDVAWQIASQVDLGIEFKQDLLEMRSENERLRSLVDALQRATGAVARRRDIKGRATGNGQVDHL